MTNGYELRLETPVGHLAATWTPAVDGGTRPVLVCIAGGAQSREYFDLDVPGDPTYSFARHARDAGWSTLRVDPLGAGGSAQPVEIEVDFEVQADALAHALDNVRHVVGETSGFIAVAHSMGGYVAMRQQARRSSYAALAILGTTNGVVANHGLSEDVVAAAATPDGRRALTEEMAATMSGAYIMPTGSNEGGFGRWFNLDDVPAPVRRAARTTLCAVPRRCAAESSTPGCGASDAASVDVPVFLAYGEVDISLSTHREPEFFASSDDVTLFILRGSAHCHNLAGTRTALWDRLLAWAGTVSL